MDPVKTILIEVTEPAKTVLIKVTEPAKTVLIKVTEPTKTVLIGYVLFGYGRLFINKAGEFSMLKCVTIKEGFLDLLRTN